MNDEDYWLGRFKNSAQILLYNPEDNSPTSPTVTFFVKAANTVRSFDRQTIRAQVEAVDDPVIKLITISAYERWRRKQKRKAREAQATESEKVRRPYCYCGEKLYTFSHKTCERCGWLVCRQNHCGCTIQWDQPDKPG